MKSWKKYAQVPAARAVTAIRDAFMGRYLYRSFPDGRPLGPPLRLQRLRIPPRRSDGNDFHPKSAAATRSVAAPGVDRRGVDPGKLSREVRGELDWMVMKALEKDRNRRYESASALAADVGRYLSDEPVAASPPSTAYRLRKFARRNRKRLAAASLALTLGLFVVGILAAFH